MGNIYYYEYGVFALSAEKGNWITSTITTLLFCINMIKISYMILPPDTFLLLALGTIVQMDVLEEFRETQNQLF